MRHSCRIGGLVIAAVACSPASAFGHTADRELTVQEVQTKPSEGNEEHRRSGPDTKPSPDVKRGPEIKTLDQFVQAIHACWRPPGRGEAPSDIMVTVRLAFTRDGQVFGKPTVTYITPGTSPEHELAYRNAIAQTFLRCTPMNLDKGLGNAIAGRPFTFTFGNERSRNRAELMQCPKPMTL
jgi:hypothetical protein